MRLFAIFLLLPAVAFGTTVGALPQSNSVEIPADATDVERLAADELVKYVRAMTGRTLPVVTQAKGPAIRLTRGAAELGDEGFRLKSEGDALVVSGGRRGILYGVYELLERYGGIEWLAADFEVVPKRAEFRLPENVDLIEKPAIFFRASSWGDLRRDGTFQAKMRINGLSYATNALPGGPAAVFCRRLGPAHTFDTLVPPSVWFKSHPEYFSEIGDATLPKERRLTRTNMNPYKGTEPLLKSGLLGPVRLIANSP